MTVSGFLLIVFSVTLSAIAQTFFKYGVSGVSIASESSLVMKVWILLTTPFVLIGLGCYGVGTIIWLFALKHIDLSLAYPFVGLSFIMVFVFGVFFLDEAFSVHRLIGTCIVIAGILVLARS